MRISIQSVLSIVLLSSLMACEESNDPGKEDAPIARVSFSGMLSETDSTYSADSEAYGDAFFSVEENVVTMTINLINFPPNTVHAVHIHEGTCAHPKAHWNAGRGMMDRYCNELSLGIPWAKPMAGDVGNVSVGYDGSGSYTLRTDLWSIGTGDSTDIAGKVVVIHEQYQDFTTECDPNHGHNHGHANAKVACGTIELAASK